MSTEITERQLEVWIDDANSIINDKDAGTDETSAAFVIRRLCEHIQECRKAEPVADVVAWHREGEERTCDIRWRRHDVAPGPLYSVPQIPDEATPDNIQMLASTFAPRGVTYQWDSDECNAAADSWNACRSAMTENKK